MTFDRRSATDLTTLKNEVNNDPALIGYSGSVNLTRDLLALLNTPASNTTGATVNRSIDDVTVAELSAVVDSTEYAALSEYDKEWVKSLIAQPQDAALPPYKAKFLSIFGAGSDTRTAALRLLSRAASRAEELFGIDTVLSRHDWIAARENG